MVRFEQVKKRFPNGVEALKGIDLKVDHAETTVVLGPSGAGKSTLLRTVNGLEIPSSGRITVDETEVQRSNLRQIRRDVGMIFQQFNLVPRLTVLANVLCGRLAYRNWVTSIFFTFPESDFELAFQALDSVGLKDRAWDRVEKLSGGQQQRVAIARTLVQQPKVVLADEPVASLDPATSEDVLEILVKVSREKSAGLLINLHQVELAQRFADRIVGIRAGEIVFDGPPSDLSAAEINNLYRS